MDFIFDPSLVLYLPLYKLDSASFMSKDAYGRICTVTGAIWQPDGRYFDGADDYIDCGSNIAIANKSFTLEVWVKRAVSGVNHHIISTGVNGTNWQQLYFRYSATSFFFAIRGDGASVYSLPSPYGVDMWIHWVGTYHQPSKLETLFMNADPVQTFTSPQDYVGPANLDIGQLVDTSPAEQVFNGLVGEVRVYTRALAPQEIRHNYLATKWRYR